ncbi:MAG: phage tail family protein [Peptoniphilus sp.]|uniref:phage distal tail protein n=1 Tax=Peptoniphilus sp. TaxID=1971214 RepID=UPI002A7616FF|nr:phage tail domain-containing protein [Peptoniphilus sp.]MDY2986140.1 phage tail family protein [Peptoniphilus sp.]
MPNRFNLSKFNIKNNSDVAITATSEFDFYTDLKDFIIENHVEKTELIFNIDSNASGFSEVFAKSETGISFESSAISTSLLILDTKVESEISFESFGSSSLLGSEYLEIKGFVLKPGEEIEINTCELTATINGENAMHLLTEDGDFFDFLPGANDIEIVAGGANGVSIDTYWKDRWL